MNENLSKSILLLILLLGYSNVFGQYIRNPMDRINAEKRIAEEEAARKREEAALKMQIMDRRLNDRRAPNTQRSTAENSNSTEHSDFDEDLNLYKDVLSQTGTGLLLIYDAAKCERNSKQCPKKFSGDGTAYSFRKSIYIKADYADIFFENAAFHLKGIGTLGFMTELGDLPLDKLSLTDKGVKELAEFEPSDKLEIIEKQFAVAQKGFQVGDFIYKTSYPLKENTTFVFRSINYRVNKKDKKISTKNEDSLRPKVDFSDMIIAFRVVRQHENGSVTVLWKILQTIESPTIILE